MSVTWDVNPYEKISQLVAAYTNATVISTVNSSEKVAKEAEAWMKKNAIWRDRTIQQRKIVWYWAKSRNLQPQRFVKPDFTGARENLKAFVVTDHRELESRRADIRKAIKADQRTLKNINWERSKEGKAPRSKLYSTQSAEAEVRKLHRSLKSPIAEVVFTHDPKVPYAIWLEIAFNGRYAIIPKTIAHWEPKLLNRIRSNLNLVQFRDQVTFGEVTSTQQQMEEYLAAGNQPWTPERQAKRRESRRRYTREVYNRFAATPQGLKAQKVFEEAKEGRFPGESNQQADARYRENFKQRIAETQQRRSSAGKPNGSR